MISGMVPNRKISLMLMKKIFNRINAGLKRRIMGWSAYYLSSIFDYSRFRYARYFIKERFQSPESRLAPICLDCHRLEKGFTMPGRHMPFGESVVRNLLPQMLNAARTDSDEFIFQYTVSVLKRYRELHNEEGAWEKLDATLRRELEAFLKSYPDIQADDIIAITREEYYSHNSDSFPLFSASRHSVRSLCGTVSMEQIEQAVSLARNAPSACNRQFARVHCICDKEVQSAVLALQNGSRGFGHLADKLLIVTTDIRDACFSPEHNDLYTNAGIFLMNLCYSLHYCKVAHCILNWFVDPATDLKLRKVVNIPDYENVVCMVACGDCPETFHLASSRRKPLKDILTVHGTCPPT